MSVQSTLACEEAGTFLSFKLKIVVDSFLTSFQHAVVDTSMDNERDFHVNKVPCSNHGIACPISIREQSRQTKHVDQCASSIREKQKV